MENKEASEEIKTGLGHQYKADEKALNTCRTTLYEAAGNLKYIQNAEVAEIRQDIYKIMQRLQNLSYSANEAYNQND